MIDTSQFLIPGRRHTSIPAYRLRPDDLDKLPLDTFLVTQEPGTEGYPMAACRVVMPNRPDLYKERHKTPSGRLLYEFYRDKRAHRRLVQIVATDLTFAFIIQPGDRGHDTLAAMKMGCDASRVMADTPQPFPDTLLMKAVGWNAKLRKVIR